MIIKTCRRVFGAVSLVYLATQLTGCVSPSGGARPSWLGPTADDWGRQVLAVGNQMVINGAIIRGGCWDYIDAVYSRAGFPESKRHKVFKSVKRGPYVDTSLIRPGDWLYFVNHSYNGIEHSAIFVEWVNQGSRKARMLSYAGQNRREPARYMNYDLSNVYTIIRPKP